MTNYWRVSYAIKHEVGKKPIIVVTSRKVDNNQAGGFIFRTITGKAAARKYIKNNLYNILAGRIIFEHTGYDLNELDDNPKIRDNYDYHVADYKKLNIEIKVIK